MTFKITDVKTKKVLHESQVNRLYTHAELLKKWAFDKNVPVDVSDANTPGTADIDVSLTSALFSRTFSYFYL